MKKLCAVILCLVAAFLFSSCTNAENGKTNFVYYFVLDGGEMEENIMLYALFKKDVKSSDKGKNELFIEAFDGRDASEAFETFFEKHKDAYTGTVKEYAVSRSLGAKALEDFKVYLTNSPGLPAKRKTVQIDDAGIYIEDKMKEQQK